jgi:hypothetical protein
MPDPRADLFFALMCFSTAAGAFFEGLAYQTVTIEGKNSVHRLQVIASAKEFATNAMFNAVRAGGREAFCLPFSWSFARAAPYDRVLG